jgi:hypothetical protein
MSNQPSARDIISDIYLAVADAELDSFFEPSGNDNAVRVVRGDNEFLVVVGDGEVDDDGNMIYMWSGYEAVGGGEFELIADSQAGMADGVRQAAQAWLQAQGEVDEPERGPVEISVAQLAEATETAPESWALSAGDAVSIFSDGHANARPADSGQAIFDITAGNDELERKVAALHDRLWQ